MVSAAVNFGFLLRICTAKSLESAILFIIYAKLFVHLNIDISQSKIAVSKASTTILIPATIKPEILTQGAIFCVLGEIFGYNKIHYRSEIVTY